MRPERTQPGNPHRLTIKQHIFPKRSIERFAIDGGVEVHEVGPGRTRRRSAADVLFCADRVWDHRTEHGLMGDIEIAFQQIAERILAGERSFAQEEHGAITDYYLLWILRHKFKQRPLADQQLRMHRPERRIDKDTEEHLEKHGVMFFRNDGTMPGRLLVGPSLHGMLDDNRVRMAGTTWGILRARPGHGEFLVPDTFSMFSIVPLTPEICLVAGMENSVADFRAIGHFNGVAVENSAQYYFARDLNQCPILKQAIESAFDTTGPA
ncbi:hypothetical protein AB4Z19_15895 [Pseudoduganella sp. RAF19]|uniref:hypothetical protein n=1 Tax=Pseudoduganella sp. RAF19 TaxID=3233052 RepID=UPI003F98D89F